VADSGLNGETLGRLVRELKENPDRRRRMEERAASLAQPRAAEKIADLCYRLVGNE
jgi:UDP-N-acetylglucosamine:LPS N-acetylglucosamine transferase